MWPLKGKEPKIILSFLYSTCIAVRIISVVLINFDFITRVNLLHLNHLLVFIYFNIF